MTASSPNLYEQTIVAAKNNPVIVTLLLIGAALTGAALVACGGTASQPSPGLVVPTGTLFGTSFVPKDALLVHPQSWKSAEPGSTALLLSDTPDFCAQITSGKTTAPGRFLIVLLEQTDANGAVVPVTPGTFTRASSGSTNAKDGGDAQTGNFSVSSTCDQTAVDKYLNANPVCG
jgi:hypothetical protein